MNADETLKAAINDIQRMIKGNGWERHLCVYCAKNGKNEPDCRFHERCKPVWRGVCKENGGER